MQILLFKKNSTRTKLHFCWHPIFFLFNPCLAAPTSMTHYAFSFSFGFKKPAVQASSTRPPRRPQETSTQAPAQELGKGTCRRSNALFLVFFTRFPWCSRRSPPKSSHAALDLSDVLCTWFLRASWESRSQRTRAIRGGNQLHHPPGAALSS
jgi:hypothetical protein